MPLLVQSASNSTSAASTLTVTLGAGTTGGAGDALVVGADSSDTAVNPHVTGITLGGSADHFGALVSPIGTTNTTAAILDIWADPNCTAGQTQVVITWSAGGAHEQQGFVYEFSGMLSTTSAASLLDQSSTNFTTAAGSTSWTSNATPTTTQASEVWFGIVGGFQTTITGPSSPWNNSAQLGTGSTRDLMVGYQIASSTGAATYSGTYSSNSFSEAGVVTLFAAAGASPAGRVQPRATIPVPRRAAAKAAVRGITGTTPAPVFPVRLPLAPRRSMARAVFRSVVGQVQIAPVGPPGSLPVLTASRTELMPRVTGRVIRR